MSKSTNTPNSQYALPKWFWRAVIMASVGITLVALGVFCWFSGWPQYLNALNHCEGHPPVLVGGLFDRTYIAPGDKDYVIPGGSVYDAYYCTVNEVESAGIKHREPSVKQTQ